MKWGELKPEHANQYVRVWATSTPKSPELGEGPYEGWLKFNGEIPIMMRGQIVHSFSWWWNVSFGKDISEEEKQWQKSRSSSSTLREIEMLSEQQRSTKWLASL